MESKQIGTKSLSTLTKVVNYIRRSSQQHTPESVGIQRMERSNVTDERASEEGRAARFEGVQQRLAGSQPSVSKAQRTISCWPFDTKGRTPRVKEPLSIANPPGVPTNPSEQRVGQQPQDESRPGSSLGLLNKTNYAPSQGKTATVKPTAEGTGALPASSAEDTGALPENTEASAQGYGTPQGAPLAQKEGLRRPSSEIRELKAKLSVAEQELVEARGEILEKERQIKQFETALTHSRDDNLELKSQATLTKMTSDVREQYAESRGRDQGRDQALAQFSRETAELKKLTAEGMASNADNFGRVHEGLDKLESKTEKVLTITSQLSKEGATIESGVAQLKELFAQPTSTLEQNLELMHKAVKIVAEVLPQQAKVVVQVGSDFVETKCTKPFIEKRKQLAQQGAPKAGASGAGVSEAGVSEAGVMQGEGGSGSVGLGSSGENISSQSVISRPWELFVNKDQETNNLHTSGAGFGEIYLPEHILNDRYSSFDPVQLYEKANSAFAETRECYTSLEEASHSAQTLEVWLKSPEVLSNLRQPLAVRVELTPSVNYENHQKSVSYQSIVFVSAALALVQLFRIVIKNLRKN